MDKSGIEHACQTYGAERVYQAAYRQLEGDAQALKAVGLNAKNLTEACEILGAAHALLAPHEPLVEQMGFPANSARADSRHLFN